MNVGFNWGLAWILVIGGRERSVEFWSAANLIPEQGSCVLEDYPRGLGGPTVNLVSGRLVTCQENACDIYLDGTWQHLQNTATNRSYHSSASTKDADMIFVKCFTLANFTKYQNLPEKKRVNRDILDSKYGI